MDDLYLFYGKDAETAAKVLGSKIVTREIPGLGETAVTGSAASWQALGEKLLQHGNSALFAHPEGETYEVPESLGDCRLYPHWDAGHRRGTHFYH